MKNMNEFLTSVANGTLTDEVIEFAKNELTKRANENAAAAQKRNDKWLAENGELIKVVETFRNQRENRRRGQRHRKRVVKTYSL